MEEEPDEQLVEQPVTKAKSKGKTIVKEPVAEPTINIIDEQPDEPNESQKYDTTIDIAYKTKILSKSHVSALRVC